MSDRALAPEGKSIEVLRAWIIGKELHCSIQGDVFPDVATWGEVLADLARYVADAAQELQGTAPDETIRRIREAFDKDLSAAPEASGE